VRGGRDAHMLAVAEGFWKITFELAAVAPRERGCIGRYLEEYNHDRITESEIAHRTRRF